MSGDVWEGQMGSQFVHDLCEEFGPVFATVSLVRPGGQHVAQATTITEDGYDPCWQTTTRLAMGTTGGCDIFGLTRAFQVDYPRDNIETPQALGTGLRLFRGVKVIGGVGVLGVSTSEVIVAVTKVGVEYRLTIADRAL